MEIFSCGIDFCSATGISVLVVAEIFEVLESLLLLHPRIKIITKTYIVVANICAL